MESNGSREWAMPHVEKGQIVGWAWTAGGAVSPAIVLEVGQTTLNLSIHVSNVKDHVYKGGVRHKDDPFLKRTPDYQGGVWHVLPRDERIEGMLRDYEEAGKTFRSQRQPVLAEE